MAKHWNLPKTATRIFFFLFSNLFSTSFAGVNSQGTPILSLKNSIPGVKPLKSSISRTYIKCIICVTKNCNRCCLGMTPKYDIKKLEFKRMDSLLVWDSSEPGQTSKIFAETSILDFWLVSQCANASLFFVEQRVNQYLIVSAFKAGNVL